MSILRPGHSDADDLAAEVGLLDRLFDLRDKRDALPVRPRETAADRRRREVEDERDRIATARPNTQTPAPAPLASPTRCVVSNIGVHEFYADRDGGLHCWYCKAEKLPDGRIVRLTDPDHPARLRARRTP